MKTYPDLLVPRACVISALLLRSLNVDAENEEKNFKKWKKSGKWKMMKIEQGKKEARDWRWSDRIFYGTKTES